MAKKQHWLDTIADEAFQVLMDDETYIYNALIAGTLPPNAHPTTEKEKLEIYRRFLMNPDGTWNEGNQFKLMNRLSPEDYVSVINALNDSDAHGQIGLKAPPKGLLNYGEEDEEAEGY